MYLGVNISVFYANPEAALTGFVLFIAGIPLYYLIRFAVNRNNDITE